MTIELADDGTVTMAGTCPIEDAEELQQCLLSHQGAEVDWRSCDAAHTAVVQVLLAAGRALRGPPRGEFLRTHVAPLLAHLARG